jgi:hypothetical protein
MEIPWSYPDRMLPLPQAYNRLPLTQYSLTAPPFGVNNSNGNLYVTVDAPLTSNQATTGIGLKLFFQWPDLEFYVPSAALRQNTLCTSGVDLSSPNDGQAVAVKPIVHLRQLTAAYTPTLYCQVTKFAATNLQGIYTYTIPLFGVPCVNTTEPSGALLFVPSVVSSAMVSY